MRAQEKQDWAEGEVELEYCNSLRQSHRGLWSWNSLGKVSQIEPDQPDMNPQALTSHSTQATSRERVQTWVRQLYSADGISPKGTQLWVVSSHHCLSTMAGLDSPQNHWRPLLVTQNHLFPSEYNRHGFFLVCVFSWGNYQEDSH